MKKMLLLFFTVLTLALGHESIVAMDNDSDSEEVLDDDSEELMAAVVTSITVSWLYRWFTRKSAEQQQKNVLINKTGAPIFITGQEQHIAANETFVLPEASEIRIKLAKDQDASKDLVINIDAYADDLNDSYLNLIIYKKWFSSFFTVPLTTSEVWVDKSKTIPSEEGE